MLDDLSALGGLSKLGQLGDLGEIGEPGERSKLVISVSWANSVTVTSVS